MTADRSVSRGPTPMTPPEPLTAWMSAVLRPIRFLDVGSSGGLSPAWSKLRPLLDYVGCDPLEAQGEPVDRGDFYCATQYASAVAPNAGTATLHVTADPDCSSLLQPNWPAVRRYHYGWRFEVRERRQVTCVTLAELARRHARFDVIKLDSQGLEYQLISSGAEVVSGALCLQVEAGLIENYAGEYPYALIDPLLRALGFSLVDFTSLSSRRLHWRQGESRHQPLWCETAWLRDMVRRREHPAQPDVATMLVLCKTLGHFAFGQELAIVLAGEGLLPDAPARLLGDPGVWQQPWRLDGWSIEL